MMMKIKLRLRCEGEKPKSYSFFRAAMALSLSALALGAASIAAAQQNAADAPVQEAELRADIKILASDEFEGRYPGSAGEMRSIAHIVGAWASAGLRPLDASSTPWLQGVELRRTEAKSGEARFRFNGRQISLDEDEILLRSRDPSFAQNHIAVVYAGYGVGRDGRPPLDVNGKAVIILLADPPFGKNSFSLRERREKLVEAGAIAVLAVADEAMPWAQLGAAQKNPDYELRSEKGDAAVRGFLSLRAFDQLMEKIGRDGASLRNDAQSANYRGLNLPMQVDIEASSEVENIMTHNIVARLAGANPDGKAVILMGHWDHLGICKPEAAVQRICSGAVDNASGIASLIAIAKRLAKGPRMDRDVIFLATTAEEKGLLGAQHFAQHPPVPAASIVAAFNLDTVAIAPRGNAVAIIGRGLAKYDAAIKRIAKSMGRRFHESGEADEFVDRQDGAAFTRRNIPAFMVGGSFSDSALLDEFFYGPYHQPEDRFSENMELGGAAEDADLHISLVRYFADRSRWDGAGTKPTASPASATAPQ